MPLPAFFLRQLRRRGLLIALAGLAIVLVIAQVYYYGSTFFSSGEEESILHLRKLNQPFAWQEEEVEGRNVSQEAIATCRNSVQGRETIADDRGYVCDRSELLASGCCDANSSTAGRFLCTSCDQVAACCGSYEDCISCCLRPEQRPGLQQILNRAAESNNVLFVSVSDHFELCLAKCRTSSSSVQHENTYRNKMNKFCYGKNPPPTVGSSSKP